MNGRSEVAESVGEPSPDLRVGGRRHSVRARRIEFLTCHRHVTRPPCPVHRWSTLAAASGLRRISSRTRSEGPGSDAESA